MQHYLYNKRIPHQITTDSLSAVHENADQDKKQTFTEWKSVNWPGTDNVACIQVNNLFKTDCKYVNRNIKVSVVIQHFYNDITRMWTSNEAAVLCNAILLFVPLPVTMRFFIQYTHYIRPVTVNVYFSCKSLGQASKSGRFQNFWSQIHY